MAWSIIHRDFVMVFMCIQTTTFMVTNKHFQPWIIILNQKLKRGIVFKTCNQPNDKSPKTKLFENRMSLRHYLTETWVTDCLICARLFCFRPIFNLVQCGDSKNTQGSPNILQLNCLESTFVALTIFKVDLLGLRYVALDYIVFFALPLLPGWSRSHCITT